MNIKDDNMGEIEEMAFMKKEVKQDTMICSGEGVVFIIVISLMIFAVVLVAFYYIPIALYVFSLAMIGISIVFVARVWSIASNEKDKAEKEIGEDGWKVINKYD
jgi:Flp pilus assembly protein TadB